ncbi:MAG: hypothetical protein K2W96_15365 [Gemmataceae bacterium]|nr:hypothetical protein [Gemmataceae bacterium]
MRGCLLLALIIATGCGTVVNLTDPARNTPNMIPNTCTPFGGVARSACLGGFGTTVGAADFCTGNVAEGAVLLPVGIGGLIDSPLSLVGDLLTLPIAYARQQGHPWASWWGKPSVEWPPVGKEGAEDAKPAETQPRTEPRGDAPGARRSLLRF